MTFRHGRRCVERARGQLPPVCSEGAQPSPIRPNLRCQWRCKRRCAAFTVSTISGCSPARLQAEPRQALSPDYTSASGNHYLSPDDIARFITSKRCGRGIRRHGAEDRGSGQTQVDVTDIQKFRAKFNLPAARPADDSGAQHEGSRYQQGRSGRGRSGSGVGRATWLRRHR